MKNPKATALRVLGIEPGATPVQLKSAYRQAAMRTHPDKGGSVIDFINVKRAYDFLVENGTELPKVQPQQASPWWTSTPCQTTGGFYNIYGNGQWVGAVSNWTITV